MASKAAIIGGTDATERDTATEEREGLTALLTRAGNKKSRIRDLPAARGQSGYELYDWLQAERELTAN
jgi:hypothetical protein